MRFFSNSDLMTSWRTVYLIQFVGTNFIVGTSLLLNPLIQLPFKGIWFYVFCGYMEVTRSRQIESDSIYLKNKERVQELRILWKKKKLHFTNNKYIETFDINTIISFYFTNSHFKDFNSSPTFLCGSPFFIFFLLPLTSLNSSGDENLFHQSRNYSRTFDFSPLTESLGVVTEERECIPGGLFSLECPDTGHQMF